MADPNKMLMADFAAKIKAQHPEYAQLDDQELANRVLAKYPQYRGHVDIRPTAADSATAPQYHQSEKWNNKKQSFEPVSSTNPPEQKLQREPGAIERTANTVDDAIVGLPSSIYHAVADPPTPEEKRENSNWYGRLPGVIQAGRLSGGAATAHAMQDYGMIPGGDDNKVTWPAAKSVLPEAIGTGIGAEVLGRAGGKAISAARGALDNSDFGTALAAKMRYPATSEQSVRGVPGDIKQIPGLPKKVQEWVVPQLAPKGRLGSPTNPGPFADVPLRVPDSVLKEENPLRPLQKTWSGEQKGAPYMPDPHYEPRPEPTPLPPRSGPLLLTEGTPEPASGVYRDATLNKRNIPEFAGEGEDDAGISPARISQYGAPRPRARMGPPLRPNVFASPEEAQIYDNRIARLKVEAKDAGMYSAARGKTSSIPDYQERIGGTMSDFGAPEPAPGLPKIGPPATVPQSTTVGSTAGAVADTDFYARAQAEADAGKLAEGMTVLRRAQELKLQSAPPKEGTNQ